MRPADITGSFETAEAAVRIGQGIENGGDFSGSLEDARNKAFSRLGMVLTLMKQVFSALRKGEVNVQAVSAFPGQRLGHEGGEAAVLGGNCFHRHAKSNEIIGGGKGVGIPEIDLVLTWSPFVMGAFRQKAHFFQSQADLPADVFAPIQRGHIVIAAPVVGNQGGISLLICAEQIEFTFCASIADVSHICTALNSLFENIAAVTLKIASGFLTLQQSRITRS